MSCSRSALNPQKQSPQSISTSLSSPAPPPWASAGPNESCQFQHGLSQHDRNPRFISSAILIGASHLLRESSRVEGNTTGLRGRGFKQPGPALNRPFQTGSELWLPQIKVHRLAFQEGNYVCVRLSLGGGYVKNMLVRRTTA